MYRLPAISEQQFQMRECSIKFFVADFKYILFAGVRFASATMFADIHHLSHLSQLAQGGHVTGVTSTVTGTSVATDASVSIYFGENGAF